MNLLLLTVFISFLSININVAYFGDDYHFLDFQNYDLLAYFSKLADHYLLDNGRVEYYIPSFWEEIQHNISQENLGSIEGYQYVLNQMPGSQDTTPSSPSAWNKNSV